jgi:BirA family biotin operon repressor/biotin-[acetyl-CoA-carboxylase] ligase
VKPLTFSVLRLLSSAEFRSGEEIAGVLGISRASVSNALADLEGLDVGVFKVRGRGYRLAEPIEWLEAGAIHAALAPRRASFDVEVVDVAHSTNALLTARAAAGGPHRTCVAAEVQTQGRGRRGRSWEGSVGGSLTFSVLWRFNQGVSQLSGLSLAVGVALVRALNEFGVPDAALKWPNDLLHGFRKMGGILIELQGDALGPAAAVIGIGLNIRLSEQVRDRIDQAVTDLASVLGEPPSRNQLLGLILAHLHDVLAEFEQAGFAALREEWQAAHAYHGRPVTLFLPSRVQERGVVAGVAEDGALLVRTRAGVERFASGEISLRAAAAGEASGAPERARG